MSLALRTAQATIALAATGTVFFTLARDELPDKVYYAKKAFGVNNKKGEMTRKPKVVVLGSGWGALSFLQCLDQSECDVVVVSPRSFFFYTPLLAGVATGTVNFSSITESMRWHLGQFTTPPSFLQAHATEVDFDNQSVTCMTIGDSSSASAPVKTVVQYDQLVVAVGAAPSTFNIPGVKEHSFMMKEIEDSLTVQKKLLAKLEYANALTASKAPEEDIRRALHWVVVGGGPTGVELTAELCDFVNSDIKEYFPNIADKISITLVEGTSKILGMFSPHISEYARDSLTTAGAEVKTDQFVTGVNEKSIKLKAAKDKTASSLDYGVMVWAGGIAARPVTKHFAELIGGVQVEKLGRGGVRGLKVDEKFNVQGVKNVWAIGDCALSGAPPTAQAAYQQGKYLGRLFRDVGDVGDALAVEEYEPFCYMNYGALAYVGSSKGVADLKLHLWGEDAPAGRGQDSKGGNAIIEGTAAFTIWRSLYFSKMLSLRNRFQVGTDWAIGSLFGREISTPWDIEPKAKK